MRRSIWYTSLAFLGLSLFCGYIFSLHSASSSDSIEIKMIDYNPIVQTAYGKVKGINGISREGREYTEFLGLEYARIPMRYKNPLPPKPWNDVKDATSYGAKCLQFDMFTDLIVGDEKCLYLNVFTPKLPPKRKFFNWGVKKRLLAVVVYIHGGHFMYGASDEYRPEYLMDENLVLVTLNYRLNSFGFLNTEDGEITGNMGLHDQVSALKWVQLNIERFGGDPSNVLLAGQSAGGASVQYHLLSPLSKGLFHAAISFSGSSLSPWAITKKPREQAKRLAENLGCPTNTTTKDFVNCLRSLDAHTIVQQHSEIHDILNDRMAFFTPTVEIPSRDSSQAFLSDTPENLIESGRISSKVPWMTGVTSEEGLIFLMGLFFDTESVERLNSDWNLYAPRLFGYEDLPDEIDRNRISQKIRAHYLYNKNIAEHSSMGLEQLFTDANFNQGLRSSAVTHSKHQPVYLYYYSHKGTFGFYQAFQAMSRAVPKLVDWAWSLGYRWFHYELAGKNEIHYGVCHGDDTVLLFKVPLLSHIKHGSEDFFLSKAFVRSIAAFAQDRNSPSFDGIKWDALEVSNTNKPLKFMRIANNSEIVDEPFHRSLTFWREEIINDIKATRDYKGFHFSSNL